MMTQNRMRSVLALVCLSNVMPRVFLIRFTVTIAAMESQIETMRSSISALKHQKEKKAKKSKKKDASASTPATGSKAAKKEAKAPTKKKSAAKKAQIPDDDVLSFEQKKDLSEAIQTLDGQKLERVIQIIHEGVPEIRDVRSLSPYVILRL